MRTAMFRVSSGFSPSDPRFFTLFFSWTVCVHLNKSSTSNALSLFDARRERTSSKMDRAFCYLSYLLNLSLPIRSTAPLNIKKRIPEARTRL